jgi:hypothetical protein
MQIKEEERPAEERPAVKRSMSDSETEEKPALAAAPPRKISK